MKKNLTTGCRCICSFLIMALILVMTPVTVKAEEILPSQAKEEKLKAAFYQYYTEEDIDLLARLMYAEVGVFLKTMNEEDAMEAFLLTGSVVLNRWKNPYFGWDDLEAVIYADGQYQCVRNGSINNNPPEEVYEWAEELLQSGPIGPDNMIFQSTLKQGTSTYKKIGNTYFCCKDV